MTFGQLEKEREYSTWAKGMKTALSSDQCKYWRARYLLPRQSRLHGLFQRTKDQQSKGAVSGASRILKKAQSILSEGVLDDLDGLWPTVDSKTSTAVDESRRTTEDSGIEPAAEVGVGTPVSQIIRNREDDNAEDLETEINADNHTHLFYEVFQALYDIAHNRKYVLPTGRRMQSKLQERLFNYTVEQLPVFKEISKTRQKDVYVAASSIAHLHMEDAVIAIGEDLEHLIEKTRNLKLAEPPSYLIDTLRLFKEDSYDENGEINIPRMTLLVNKEIGNIASNELDGNRTDTNSQIILDILRIVLPLCKEDAVPRPNDTEQKCQSVWQRILEILFADTRISVVIGETGLASTKTERAENEAAHSGTSTNKPVMPRKVDCKLVASVVKAKKWEFKPISNFEFKSMQASSQQVEIQARKNMRLNHSISKNIPSKEQLFLNIHGYSAQLYRLWEYESVHVCGRVFDEELVIPTCEPELEWFLDGKCLATLLSLRTHFLRVAQEVQRDHARPIKTDVATQVQFRQAEASPARQQQSTQETNNLPAESNVPLALCQLTNNTFYTPKRPRANSATVIDLNKKLKEWP
ncbi:hypothetical protein BGX21_001766 [Mortierella sp. AD011]|nr:hypothetical protein BGX21_001766 [Mortierella sp. AD011]